MFFFCCGCWHGGVKMLDVKALTIEMDAFSLRDLSLRVESGAYFVLLGASGVGKSVLLECIAGLCPPVSGSIWLDGVDITHAHIQERSVGLVYQDEALFPHLTVYENVAYGLRARGEERAEIDATVRSLAAQTGLEEMLERKPGTLSGGERQRVSLARALAREPQCLLLDEPLSALDAQARPAMRSLLREVHRSGQTIVHVTHDYEEAISLATHVGVIEDGRIVQEGTPAEIFQHPKSEFVARFVGVRNFFHGTLSYPDGGSNLGEFASGDLSFSIATDAPGGPGHLLLRSEDLTLSAARPEGSARNTFAGKVSDIAPARLGVEVMVDLGVEVAAMVTQDAVKRMELAPGKDVWVSFKATAGRFIEE